MSNREPAKSQLDWQEQYPQYLPQSESSTVSPHLDQLEDLSSTDSSIAGYQFGELSHLVHGKGHAQLADREGNPNHRTVPLLDPPSRAYEQPAPNEQVIDTSRPENPTGPSLTSAPRGSLLPVEQPQRECSSDQEDEDDYDDEDDEMLEPDDGSGPQTEAERRAERRKMKRFRLTHQQTRFLMSEFAKQAHPDATHRENLSRQIPGLSSRQVQVWFQNRRAKIKRLTADDRERMLRMRAVPDDFDNIQALHSPYGAVHGIGTPLPSPVDYASSYGEQGMMRPLVVDPVHQHERGEQHVSQTGLSPSFGHVGFGPSGSMTSPDVLSPLSLNSGDRYYGSHILSPLSAGSQGPNAFPRHNSNPMHSQPHSSRHLQPMQLRESMSRLRSESSQSPLRSSMLRKESPLNYAKYSTISTNSNTSAKQQSLYQPEQASTSPAALQDHDPSAFPNSNPQAPPGEITYPHPQPSSLQSSAMNASRFRSSSSVFVPEHGLRFAATQQANSNSAVLSAHSNLSNTAGFASAPLNAPPDFRLPRTPTDFGTGDYSLGQLSAPMAPPQDFVNAYNHFVGPGREPAGERALNIQQIQQQSSESSLQEQPTQDADFLRQDNHGNGSDHKRKRTWSMPVSFEGL